MIPLAAVGVLLSIQRRSTIRLIIAALAVLSLLGSGIMTGRLLTVASHLGIPLNPLSTGPSTRSPDETINYSAHDVHP